MRAHPSPFIVCLLTLCAPAWLAAQTPEAWRHEHRIIDMHMHVGASEDHFARAVRIMDAAGIGIGVNLSGGVVTHAPGEKSEFERVKEMADRLHPGRFVHYMNLDYAGWNEPDFAERAAQQIEEGRRLGAAGLKEYKRLGLFLRDAKKELVKIDDPKLDPVWLKCGELGLPVSIHVADPRAFWLPFDANNERWTELKDHKSWWFGDPAKHPPREELLAALNRVIEKHPGTTFVCVHFANNSEDIEWVDRALDEHPNMNADLAARIPELGRHDPEKLRRLFTKHAGRIFFATDFMIHNKLILGSGGDADQPTDEDALVFYKKCWRWLETADRDWPHMTPIQGDWTINSIQLTPDALRKIYFDNATHLLARALPLPVIKATHITRDFNPDGKLDEPEWKQATPIHLEYQSNDATPRADISTSVRALWSKDYLYLAYECPFTKLTTFLPAQKEERIGMWEKDVVEAFIASELPRYTEYEWAPNGDWLDLSCEPQNKDFGWNSGMESAASVDETNHIWRVEVRIPMKALTAKSPEPGTRWRINLYRHDTATNGFTAFSPTLTNSFHTPERFGWLEFAK